MVTPGWPRSAPREGQEAHLIGINDLWRDFVIFAPTMWYLLKYFVQKHNIMNVVYMYIQAKLQPTRSLTTPDLICLDWIIIKEFVQKIMHVCLV